MARIMLVDDDVELADNMAAVLRDQGHEVSILTSAQDAVLKVAEQKPDLVILDVMFPDNPVAGFDVARQIRRTKGIRDLPIIMLTGINQEFPMDFSGKDIDSEWLPVQEFMEKPVKLPVLIKTIKRLLKSA
ncbi:MAG: hypothetical protein A2498_09795 [Lentisphaerae bacterium RIFOXYC12_FULL_60_16]|nr:MAG: hypothetical protein A2498_09795 [Lentisphaerae bacterium RIFOXYC12_FULL_60_16]OGV84934.1 MAG: hypothetical protein A2340_04615 [Lentisphaerae bacterium RIFOXYB12_FULL_60_10]